MSVYDDVLEAVVGLANQTNPYAKVTVGPLPPANGISIAWSAGNLNTFLDKKAAVSMSAVLNAKHIEQQKAADAPQVLHNGGIAMDDGAKSVTVDGEGVSLTPIEYNILLLLMRHPGRVFSTSQIYERVWNDPSLGSENTVAVHIRHLREKLEIDPANPRYIKVVWGLGYKMEKA